MMLKLWEAPVTGEMAPAEVEVGALAESGHRAPPANPPQPGAGAKLRAAPAAAGSGQGNTQLAPCTNCLLSAWHWGPSWP